ncbi:hypothetical protein KM043_003029 [Ampulex compressa]|nr:hypothetical protein KM043_003029 [Ampulex compressa]
MKLTLEALERKSSRERREKFPDKDVKKEQAWKLTHLCMNDRFIGSIGNLDACQNLKAIYLQNNNISKIENLGFARNLTHLYLQHNSITRMENLDSLSKLRTLYLGHNKIKVLEGLENLHNLTVLHVENQKNSDGESLCFEPRTMIVLSTHLKVLNVSGNKIRSVKALANLRKLENLEAADNMIVDIEDLAETIKTLVALRDLSLQGNPVLRQYRSKETLIANNDTLERLNGKVITDACRTFMKQFKIEKLTRRTEKSSKSALGKDITDSLNLPPAFKRSISRAIFQQTIPKLPVMISSAIDEAPPHIFPPWKTALTSKSPKDNRVTPRPFWGNIIRNKGARRIPSSISTKAIPLPPI